MIPGRFRDQYVEVKDDLIKKEGSGFAALAAFLKDKATMVQTHLPDRLMDSAKESQPKKHELKKIKELEARLAKYEAKVEEKPGANKPYTTEASEEKVGKCLVCNEFHYFQAKKGKSAGLTLASSFLTGCPKYKEATVEGKADIIVAT